MSPPLTAPTIYRVKSPAPRSERARSLYLSKSDLMYFPVRRSTDAVTSVSGQAGVLCPAIPAS